MALRSVSNNLKLFNQKIHLILIITLALTNFTQYKEIFFFIYFYFFMALRSVSNIVCSNGFTVCINKDQNVVSLGKSHYGANGNEEKICFIQRSYLH